MKGGPITFLRRGLSVAVVGVSTNDPVFCCSCGATGQRFSVRIGRRDFPGGWAALAELVQRTAPASWSGVLSGGRWGTWAIGPTTTHQDATPKPAGGGVAV